MDVSSLLSKKMSQGAATTTTNTPTPMWTAPVPVIHQVPPPSPPCIECTKTKKEMDELRKDLNRLQIQVSDTTTARSDGSSIEEVPKNLVVTSDPRKIFTKKNAIAPALSSSASLAPKSKINMVTEKPNNAFEEERVINQILHNLPRMDHRRSTLGNCRLLNRQWNAAINSRLASVMGQKLKFCYDRTKKIYAQKNGTISQFGDRFRKKSFPFSRIYFEGSDLDSSFFIVFFKNFGHHVTWLSLKIVVGPFENCPSVRSLRRLLLRGCPKLVHLHLESLPLEWKSTTRLDLALFPEPPGLIELPTLKSLDLRPSFVDLASGVVRDILMAANNLTEIHGLDLDTITLVAATKKLKTVKTFWCHNLQSNLDLERCRTLASAGPRLAQISFRLGSLSEREDLWPEVGQVLSKILKSSQLTLRHIDYFHPLAFLTGLQIPSFFAVREITFGDFEEEKEGHKIQNRRLFPPLHQPSRMFSEVKKITFRLGGNGLFSKTIADSFFVNHLECFSNQKLSVEIDGLCDSIEDRHCLKKLGKQIIRVKNLVLSNIELDHVPKLLEVVWWSFSHAETIQVRALVRTSINEEFGLQMDSAITGFSPETCKDLRLNSRNVSLEDSKGLRARSSILDLSSLLRFQMDFSMAAANVFGVTLGQVPIFSHVAGIYGFLAVRMRGQKPKILFTAGHYNPSSPSSRSSVGEKKSSSDAQPTSNIIESKSSVLPSQSSALNTTINFPTPKKSETVKEADKPIVSGGFFFGKVTSVPESLSETKPLVSVPGLIASSSTSLTTTTMAPSSALSFTPNIQFCGVKTSPNFLPTDRAMHHRLFVKGLRQALDLVLDYVDGFEVTILDDSR